MERFFGLVPWLAFAIIVVVYLVILRGIWKLRTNDGAQFKWLNGVVAVVGLLTIVIAAIFAVVSGLGLIDLITPEQSISFGTGAAGFFILLALVINRMAVKKEV